MALSVISFATYKRPPYSSDAEFHALKFVKAVKGKTFRGWAEVPVLGRNERLEPSNAEDALDWFAELAASEIRKLRLSPPLSFVAVPNTSSTVKSGKVPRTFILATAIAAQLKDAEAADIFRWKKEMLKSHQEGTRDPQELYDNLVLTANPPMGGTVLLVDDVYTKGSHLRAAAARLKEKGTICTVAVCAGRTVLECQDEPFLVRREHLLDFTPRQVR